MNVSGLKDYKRQQNKMKLSYFLGLMVLSSTNSMTYVVMLDQTLREPH